MSYETAHFTLWPDANEKENPNEIKMGEYCYKIYNIAFYHIYKFIFQFFVSFLFHKVKCLFVSLSFSFPNIPSYSK